MPKKSGHKYECDHCKDTGIDPDIILYDPYTGWPDPSECQECPSYWREMEKAWEESDFRNRH